MTDLNIKLKIKDEGADEAVSSFDGLENEVEQLADAFQELNREAARAAGPIGSVEDELNSFTRAANDNGIALGHMGSSSRNASGGLASLVNQAGGGADILGLLGGSGQAAAGDLLGLGAAAGEGGAAMGEMAVIAGEGGAALGAVAGPVGIAVAAIGVAFVGAVAAAAAAYKTLTDVIIPFSNELERQMGIMNRTQGSVEEASEAIGGLVSNIDLVTARNRLMQAGIELTDRDFAAVAEKAVDFAAATGDDAVGAMQRLGQALRTTSAEGLQEFGIQVDASKSKSEQFQDALSQLRTQAAAMETGADTLGGAFQRLDVFVENAKSEFIRMFDSSEGLRREIVLLWEEVIKLARAFGVDLSNPMNQVRRAFALLIGTMQEAIRATRVFMQAWQRFNEAVNNLDFSAAIDELATMGDQLLNIPDRIENSVRNSVRVLVDGARDMAEAAASAPEESTRASAGGGAGAATRERTAAVIEAERARAVELGQIDRVVELTQELIRLEEARGNVLRDNSFLMNAMTPPSEIDTFLQQQERMREQAQADFDAEVSRAQIASQMRGEIIESVRETTEAEAERARIQQQILGLMGDQQTVAEAFKESFLDQLYINDQIIDRFITERDVQAAMIDDFGRRVELQEVYNDLLITARERSAAWSRTQQQVNQRIDQFRPLVQQSVDLLIEGGENMEESLLRVLETWLKNFAIQEGFEAAKEFVFAIAAAARQDYTAAGQHAAAGAGHAALAIAAGGSAAGIAAASGGGGAEDQNQQQEDTGASRVPGEVIINIQGQSLLTRAEIGREVRRALTEERNRF